MTEWYTVNYKKLAEVETNDDTMVLSIDFSDEARATQFYNDIIEGNVYGQGYRAELIWYGENSIAYLGSYEW